MKEARFRRAFIYEELPRYYPRGSGNRCANTGHGMVPVYFMTQSIRERNIPKVHF